MQNSAKHIAEMIETNLIVILFSAAVKRHIIYLCWIKISIAKYSEYYFAKIVQKVWEVCTSHLNTFFMSYDIVECRVTGFDTFLQKLCKKTLQKCAKNVAKMVLTNMVDTLFLAGFQIIWITIFESIKKNYQL